MLPFIKETLSRADFVAIDFEMTGVQASPLLRNSSSDSVMAYIFIFSLDVRTILEEQGEC